MFHLVISDLFTPLYLLHKMNRCIIILTIILTHSDLLIDNKMLDFSKIYTLY